MSRTYTIKTDIKINLKDIFENLVKEYSNLSAEKREENYVYFYLNGMSSRGVDVSIEDIGYEIRNTVMSNKADLMLAHRIIMYLMVKTKSMAYNEDDEIIEPNYLLNKDNFENGFKDDLKTIFIFIEGTGETIEFPGPTRSVFIGKTILNKYSNYKNNINFVSENIENLFLKVLYNLPDYTEGNLMGADSKEGKMIKIKIVTHDDCYIIQNYDYIIVSNEDETNKDEMVMVNIQNIRKVLPPKWEINDEITLVAPKLTLENWKHFRAKCKEVNCYNEFSEKAK